tara:strand:+ start:448 stop:630 length:183 start_codon:yes stop_codon:yes gene_type:complete
MATNKQIIEALRAVGNSFPTPTGYFSVHRSFVSISNGQSVMSSDVKEINAVIRNGNGDNK